jgi:hypothetical protein
MIRESFIGRGMHMEFARADYLPVTTSRVVEVTQIERD